MSESIEIKEEKPGPESREETKEAVDEMTTSQDKPDRMVRRSGKRGRRPAKIDSKAKLERSRQSARECRARKKLRYQYLEEMVSSREKAIYSLREELETVKQMCIQIDKGTVPPEVGPFFERDAQRKAKIRKKKKSRKKSRSFSQDGENERILSTSSSLSVSEPSTPDDVFPITSTTVEDNSEKKEPKDVAGKRKRRVLSNTENNGQEGPADQCGSGASVTSATTTILPAVKDGISTVGKPSEGQIDSTTSKPPKGPPIVIRLNSKQSLSRSSARPKLNIQAVTPQPEPSIMPLQPNAISIQARIKVTDNRSISLNTMNRPNPVVAGDVVHSSPAVVSIGGAATIQSPSMVSVGEAGNVNHGIYGVSQSAQSQVYQGALIAVSQPTSSHGSKQPEHEIRSDLTFESTLLEDTESDNN